MGAKKKILFVDDEQNVLDGIRRMLHSMRDKWDMSFVNSGFAALELLEDDDFDVIVSDIVMPGMTGVELLSKVQRQFPNMVRIALSGQAGKEQIMNSVGPIHQYLAKPSDAETIRASLLRSCALRSLVKSEKLQGVISKIDSLPSLPALYLELIEELKKEDAEIQVVARIVGKDIGMSTKVLQLVNSAFFGVRKHVASSDQAVKLLGIDTIEGLVLSIHIFSQFDNREIKGMSLETTWNHGLTVGACAKKISKAEKADSKEVDNSFLAGTLHDIGKIILAANLPDDYSKVLEISRGNGGDIILAESEVFGVTHAEVGAYLLGLWGFADSIVEAVQFHHFPTAELHMGFSPLTAVNFANSVVHYYRSKDSMGSDWLDCVDKEYFEEIGLIDRLPAWCDICLETIQQREETDE